jgi:transposase
MTLADQAAIAGKDGQVTSGKPKRRTFPAAYKAKILAAYEQAGPGERGALLRREGLHTSHISDWRKAERKGAEKGLADKPSGRPPRSTDAVEIEKLKKENEKLTAELARTKAALEVVGKAHALCATRGRTLLSGLADWRVGLCRSAA